MNVVENLLKVIEQLVASRKFWITISSLIVSVAAMFGLPADKAARVAGDVVTLGGILVAAIALEDHGKSMAQANQNKDDASGGEPPEENTGPTRSDSVSNLGATVVKSVLLCLLCCLLFMTTGCKSGASVDALYVSSDRATLEAAKPLLAKESTDHPEDTPAVSNLVASWEGRVAAKETTAK